jgi:DNA primase
MGNPEIEELLARVSLASLFEHDLGQPVRTGRWLTYRCPCHEDKHPSLAITPDRRHWVCFGRCNTHGDAVDWVRKRQGLSFGQACDHLRALSGSLIHTNRIPRMGKPLVYNSESPPAADWQAKAREIIESCRFGSNSRWHWRVRDYLTQRCLYDSTLEYWQIGFQSWAGERNGLWVPRGIVIPWIERDAVWALKVRLTDDTQQGVTSAPKYAQVAGGRPALFGAHTLLGREAVVVTEGEFDAMLIHQHAGDLVGVVTLGSAAARVGWAWLREFLSVKVILAAQDADAAGGKAASWWQALSARVHRVRVPMGKDVTEFAQRGGQVRDWVQMELARVQGAI